ncbi:MAG: hypothetical protein ACOYM3_24755 [Terrimicrobiaceae bacterium]
MEMFPASKKIPFGPAFPALSLGAAGPVSRRSIEPAQFVLNKPPVVGDIQPAGKKTIHQEIMICPLFCARKCLLEQGEWKQKARKHPKARLLSPSQPWRLGRSGQRSMKSGRIQPANGALIKIFRI